MSQPSLAKPRVDYSVVVNKTPSSIASQLLSKTGQEGPPVDLDAIIKDWAGVRTFYANLTGNGYLIDQGDSSASILLDKTSEETRRSRFTLAHEIAHWILHRFAEKIPPSGDLKVEPATEKKIEKWCDLFAAELLMPSSWVTRFAGPFEAIGRSDVLFRGPKLFDVSREAFYLRLEKLYHVNILEIAASGKIVSWSKNIPHIDKKIARELMGKFSTVERAAYGEGRCQGPFKFHFPAQDRWLILIAS